MFYWGQLPTVMAALPEKETQPNAHTDRRQFHRSAVLAASRQMYSGWLPAAEVSVMPIGEAGVAS